MSEQLDKATEALELLVIEQTRKLIEDAAKGFGAKTSRTLREIAESYYPDPDKQEEVREAAMSPNSPTDPSEDFDNWLPITQFPNALVTPTEGELRLVRDTCRMVCMTSSVAKNIQFHRRNFIVGRGVKLNIFSEADDQDPEKLANKKPDSNIDTMLKNWKTFCRVNKFNEKLRNWQDRVDRDGEAFVRIFAGSGEGDAAVPRIRFVDPYYVGTSLYGQAGSSDYLGIRTDGKDEENVQSYTIRKDYLIGMAPSRPKDNLTPENVPAEEMIHDKRNVDTQSRRGVPTYWSVLPNLRRLQKILVNTSVVAQIQSAIALIRKHKSASQAKVDSFVNRQTDGKSRTDATTGDPIRARKLRPGTILDAPVNVEYDYPGHQIKMEGYIAAALQELQHIANVFVQPVDWLIAKEPEEPLTSGSPVVKNFEAEQAILYDNVIELFWRIQKLMGIKDADTIRDDYRVVVHGPILAIGKALDQARTDQIYATIGAMSVPTIAERLGGDYVQERSQAIKHRNTAQDGEVMPGDSGNTNPDGAENDGTTTKNGSSKSADGDGGATR